MISADDLVPYLKAFNNVKLSIPLHFKFQHTNTSIGMWAGAVADVTAEVTGPAYKDVYAQIGGRPAGFSIGGWSAIPEKFTLSKIMSWGEGNDPVEPTTGTSGDITITTVPLDISLVADGEALGRYTAELGDTVDEKYDLVYNKTMLAAMAAGLPQIKVGAISTGSSIKSADVTGPDAAIKGLTVAFDGANGALTIKGSADEVGDVELALYMGQSEAWTKLVITDTKATDSATILATPISDDNGIPAAYIIATFVLSVKDTSAQEFINEVIANDANKAVSADVANGRHSFLFVVDHNSNKILSLNGKSEDIKPLSDDNDAVSMKMAFLDVDASGKLVDWVDAPEYLSVVISDDKGADLTESFGVLPTNPLDVDGGVADIIVKNDSAPNGEYTVNVKVADDPLRGSLYAAERPAVGNLLAQQKISVAKTDGSAKSSGGACDMGFGLAAVAGLAAIALKRRGR